jgi:hypothetical protein
MAIPMTRLVGAAFVSGAAGGGSFALVFFAEALLIEITDGTPEGISVLVLMIGFPVPIVVGAVVGSVPAWLLGTPLWLLGQRNWEAAHWSAWVVIGTVAGLAMAWLLGIRPDAAPRLLFFGLAPPFPVAGGAAAAAFRTVMLAGSRHAGLDGRAEAPTWSAPASREPISLWQAASAAPCGSRRRAGSPRH